MTEASKTKQSRDLLPALIAGLRIMTPRERRSAIWLGIATLLTGLLDMVALATTMPFIGLIIDPGLIQTSPFLKHFRGLLDSIPPDTVVMAVGLSSLALVLASGILGAVLQRRVNRFAAECQARLARDLLDDLVRAPYAWFLTINSSVVAHVFQRDVFIWSRELVLKALTVFRDIVMIVLPAVLVVLVVPLIGLLTILAVGAITTLLLVAIRPRIEALVAIKQDADSRAHLLATQALAGVKDVKLSGREQHFVNQFAKSYGTFASSQASLANWHQAPSSLILLAGQVGLFVIALALWWANADRALLASQLALLVLVTSRVLPAASRLSATTTVIFGVMPAIRAIVSMRDTLVGQRHHRATEAVATHPTSNWQRIELDHVGFSYRGSSAPAINTVSLAIDAGLAYGVVGPSGAGKSTLVDIIMGLLVPSGGTVRIDGKPLTDISVRAWQKHIGYVAQSPFIADETLSGNVAFGVQASQVNLARLERAIDMADLNGLVSELHEGLATQLGERGLRLSGGQRQRIAIARALYNEANLLVLDEATSALDNVSERSVQEAIERLRGRVATVTIAHRLSTVRNCDRIFVVDGGNLVASGTYDALLDTSPLFRAMVDAAERTTGSA